MRTILLTGKNGQIGWELRRTLAPLGEIAVPGREEMDLAKPQSIRDAVRRIQPDLIVNAAAYTAVDQAESEPELAMAVNGAAPGILAQEARRLGAALVHYSTDYVFDGTKSGAYDESDPPAPPNIYGKTKLEGEQAIEAAGIPHLIFRTSWVYGNRGKNFLLTMLRIAKARDELRIVDDQAGAPTWSRLIAEATAQVLSQALGPQIEKCSGIYHLSAAGQTTWFGFAQAIFEGRNPAPRLVPITTRDYPLPAARPANSVLAHARIEKAFGITLPDWETGLRLCLEDAG